MEDRTKLPCLDEKGLDGKRNYNYLQWFDWFKQNTKWKNEMDFVPLINEKRMAGREWNTEEKKIQQDFLWALGQKATNQNMIWIPNQSGSYQNRKVIQIIQKI